MNYGAYLLEGATPEGWVDRGHLQGDSSGLGIMQRPQDIGADAAAVALILKLQ